MAEQKKSELQQAGTPSALALAEVGKPKEDASDEDLNKHAEKYAEAKKKARWG